jgi:8-oxo-dGTP pyrophosphatase MutT (NUDIX family)
VNTPVPKYALYARKKDPRRREEAASIHTCQKGLKTTYEDKLIMFHFTKGACTNCGIIGHSFRGCSAPVTSFGTIIFRVNDCSWNQATILATNPTSVTGFENYSTKIEVLLIQRRDSLGFVEILRGKYNPHDIEYIRKQIQGMTDKERERLLTLSFDDLWSELWGIDARTSSHYRNDKEISRQKLQLLRDGYETPEGKLSLESLVEQCTVHWNTPEWGFPKGRRDPHENDLACALREMSEETGIKKEDANVIQNIEPLCETFYGSNHVHYCHKYYTIFMKNSVNVVYDETNLHMKREIGNIQWFSLEDALNKIRPDNHEKREIIKKLSGLLQNFCPVLYE